MISLAQALKLILTEAKPLGCRGLPLAELIQTFDGWPLVLGEDILSGRNLPAFANSAMDGFALLSEDLQDASPQNPVSLQLVGEVQAGLSTKMALKSSQTIRIMTGAPIPQGADAVIAQEITTLSADGRVQISGPVRKGENIRFPGEDIRQGEILFKSGTLLKPTVLSVLASVGCAKIQVVAKPRVAFMATGEELVPFDQTPADSQIVDSNSVLLETELRGIGCEIQSLGICRDREPELENRFRQAFDSADVVISCGGVSVGKYDLVQEVFKKIGGEVVFWKVAVKPGKPVVFGRLGKKLFFGLPGNPVAVAVLFEELVRPAIFAMRGYQAIFRQRVLAKTQEPLRADSKRLTVYRVLLEKRQDQWFCKSAGMQGSHVLSTMAKAQGLALLPATTEELATGSQVWVQVLGEAQDLQEKWLDEIPE